MILAWALAALVVAGLFAWAIHNASKPKHPAETPIQRRYRELKQAEATRSREEQARTYTRKREEFQSTFRCQHRDGCSFVSSGPSSITLWERDYSRANLPPEYERSGFIPWRSDGFWRTYEFWSAPSDMFQCLHCQQWFCEEHTPIIFKKEAAFSRNGNREECSPRTGSCYSCEVARMEGRTPAPPPSSTFRHTGKAHL
jgi:hypothetical protein